MAWGLLDDKLWKHPKLQEIPERHRNAALGLFVRLLSYCNDMLTDGYVERGMVMAFGGSRYRTLAQVLVDVGFLDADERDFRIHDFLEYNRSKEQVLALRAQKAEVGKLGAESRWHHPRPKEAGFGWGPSWEPLAEAWHERGYRRSPSEKQRALLWPIVDARPNDAAKWLRNAPAGLPPFDAVQFVIGRWRMFREDAA